jgi:hypothetical protein
MITAGASKVKEPSTYKTRDAYRLHEQYKIMVCNGDSREATVDSEAGVYRLDPLKIGWYQSVSVL